MIANLVPRRFFLTRGVGVHPSRLVSFELALRDAGIPQFNLVPVSSILPPHCEQVPMAEGLEALRAGEIVFCVLARADTNEEGEQVGAGVALARPVDTERHGYVAEHHGGAMDERQVAQLTEHMAVEMLAGSMAGSDPEPPSGADLVAWARRGRLRDTLGMAQVAAGAGGERWTTVIAALVFILGAAG